VDGVCATRPTTSAAENGRTKTPMLSPVKKPNVIAAPAAVHSANRRQRGPTGPGSSPSALHSTTNVAASTTSGTSRNTSREVCLRRRFYRAVIACAVLVEAIRASQRNWPKPT
jgi:hypothetical protein